ncbi:hypothetical protein KJ840_02030 [Patescibacteria group bacterium]|nr:hypothetical protein [Patescibacteria group bacterium]
MFKITATICFLLLMFFFITATALAQDIGITNSLKTIADTGGFKTDSVADDAFLNTAAGGLIAMALGLVGLLFLGLTIYSGIQWMTAGGNEEQVAKARKKIINAAIGLGVVILAYVISNAVFALFYQISERDNTGITPQGLACQTSNECPGSYVCVDNQCKKLCSNDGDCEYPGEVCNTWTGACETGWGSNCENNSDCPSQAPVCQSFLIWKMCTCTGPNSCEGITPPKPYCMDIETQSQGYSENPAECVQCYEDNHCPGSSCNQNTHTCN